MINTVLSMEASLKQQLASLTEEIRTVESSLMATKEGYLKVQGALEVLEILKKELPQEQEDESVALALQ